MWCLTCDQDYPLTPAYWLVQSRRRRHPDTRVSVCDASGNPIEDYFLYCLGCQAGKNPKLHRCWRCKEIKPWTLDYFNRQTSKVLNKQCRVCQKAWSRKKAA